MEIIDGKLYEAGYLTRTLPEDFIKVYSLEKITSLSYYRLDGTKYRYL